MPCFAPVRRRAAAPWLALRALLAPLFATLAPLFATLAPLFATLALLGPLALSGCDDDDPVPVAGPAWQTVAADLPVALLGIWGRSATDVWAVGSDAGDGPWILHYDGVAWRRIATEARGTLWWVWGAPDGAVWMAGDAGLVLRLDAGATTPTLVPTPNQNQLFGVFPAPDGTVWAVGGDVMGQRGEVWRLEDGAFVVDTSVPAEAAEQGAFFKVWGRGADDLWVVGLGGVALRRGADGAWRTHPVPQGRRLFTVHGTAETSPAPDGTVLAVGGFQSGLAVQATAAGVTDRTSAGLPQLNGVWVTGARAAVGVGVQGAVYRWDGDTWTRDVDAERGIHDWHAVYVDPEGGIWTVGGYVVAEPLSEGRLDHFGAPVAPFAL